MDNKQVEEKAINYLKRFIEDSSVISPYLTENDKEPCWDGHLYLHKDEKKDKNHLIGRVPVQVKGHEVDSFQIKNWKFTLERPDLEAYLHEPTFYIVCQIKKGSKDRMLFYKELLPGTVRSLLKDMGNHKTRKTVFKPLTDDLSEFERQLRIFMDNSRRMISFAGKKPMSVQEAVSNGIRQFSFLTPVMNANKLQLFKYLTTHYTYLYAKPFSGFDIEVPVGEEPVKFTISQHMKKDVKVGDKVFFNSFKSEIIDGRIILSIANVMKLDLPMDASDKRKSEVKLTPVSNTLNGSIKETEFALAIHDQGEISVGDITLRLKVNDEGRVNKLRKRLEDWKRLKCVLDKLHVTKDLLLDGITAEQSDFIDILIDTVGNGKSKKIQNQQSCIMIMEISNIKILLWCSVDENGNATFGDYFDHKISIVYQVNENECYPASLYSYLKNNHQWEIVDNINYADIVPSTEKICSEHDFGFDLANYDVLALLEAYDSLKVSNLPKSKSIIDAATNLCSWLIEHDTKDKRKPVHIINKMQIFKRERDLTPEEIDELEAYLIKDATNDMNKVGICLLLDRQEEAEFYYKKLSEEDKQAMREFPIWSFKKKLYANNEKDS